MRIRHLFISSGHSYFGHHGKPAGKEPMVEVPEAECVAGYGLKGDRFYGYQADYKGQITLFAMETYEAVRRDFQLPELSPAAFRRNVLTAGVDLNMLIGQTFSLQGIELQGMEECRPCSWMDQAVAPGAENWLKGRGGLRCRVLSDGVLRKELSG